MGVNMRVALAALTTSIALVVAACSTGDDTAGTSASTTAAAGGTGTVTVPDAYTGLILTPIGDPTFPFLGTDGKYHVAYDLQLTNATPVPATLDKLDVVDGTDPSKVIASFSGSALVEPNCPYGDCNRLRMLTAPAATSTAVPPQESRIVFVDYTFDSLDQAPKAVLHHLYGSAAAAPSSREPSPVDYLTTALDIDAGSPRVISPPLKGDNWIALNGCCLPGFPHRTSPLPVDGKINNSQRFAIDWKRTNDQGEFYTGDRTKNESYVDYGSDVYAVADGTVVATLDDVPANAPGTLPAEVPELAAKLTVENVDGNHVVLDLGGGVYAMYAHFIEGSLVVKPGDQVKKGDKIARLGNTGNANASHLHFQLMNGPSLLYADGLPYVFDSFDYAGQVAPQQILAADDYLSGRFLQGKLPSPEPRTDQLPTNLAIVNFP
ncbi:M23 family metallopeptidase [Rhodococcus opacus]|nr:M23 family metallopeptidase [Rhodococcus opacus]